MAERMRKIFAVGLCLALCLLCACALASAKGKYGNLTWKLDDKRVLTISGKGAMIDGGEPGSEIGWRSHRTEIKKVKISEGITSIGNVAFYNCSSLKSISIPSSVTRIGKFAFSDCAKLKSITIPAGVKDLNARTFDSCSISKVKIDQNNKAFCVADGAIYTKDMKKLVWYPTGLNKSSFKIRKGTQVICEYAFAGSKLETITIPEGVKEIQEGAFTEMEKLKKISLPSGIKTFGQSLFNRDPNLQTVSLAADLNLDPLAQKFQDCRQLTKISIPKSGKYYQVKDNTVYSKDMTVLHMCLSSSDVAVFRVPSTIRELGSCAFTLCHSPGVILPEGMTAIGNSDFYHSKITRIYIPRSVKTIGDYAFCSAPVTDVFYGGSEKDRKAIDLPGGYDYLTKSVWHYNASPEDILN